GHIWPADLYLVPGDEDIAFTNPQETACTSNQVGHLTLTNRAGGRAGHVSAVLAEVQHQVIDAGKLLVAGITDVELEQIRHQSRVQTTRAGHTLWLRRHRFRYNRLGGQGFSLHRFG